MVEGGALSSATSSLHEDPIKWNDSSSSDAISNGFQVGYPEGLRKKCRNSSAVEWMMFGKIVSLKTLCKVKIIAIALPTHVL